MGLGERIDISEIGKYIKNALESQEEETAKIACGIISDLSNSKGENLNQYLADFVPCLHNILQNTDCPRTVKLPAIHALGSLSLNSGDAFNSLYLGTTMQILNMAAQMSITDIQQYQNDPDT